MKSVSTWLRRLRQRWRRFFDGDPVEHDGGPLVLLNHTIRHPLARFLLACGDFWLRHWQWLVGIAVAIALALVTKR